MSCVPEAARAVRVTSPSADLAKLSCSARRRSALSSESFDRRAADSTAVLLSSDICSEKSAMARGIPSQGGAQIVRRNN